ncbi:hypothetical protein B0H17DRAFT_1140397 [Mycena rosella]|uniref:Uncharacterized protein n=1 Tax=Mycena rosella TaxID=1033263 RepID=A0AAD7D203_MYCRO|nr:hypothetical protein B0H17DRAFT_1140397 [Mycena rosella]
MSQPNPRSPTGPFSEHVPWPSYNPPGSGQSDNWSSNEGIAWIAHNIFRSPQIGTQLFPVIISDNSGNNADILRVIASHPSFTPIRSSMKTQQLGFQRTATKYSPLRTDSKSLEVGRVDLLRLAKSGEVTSVTRLDSTQVDFVRSTWRPGVASRGNTSWGGVVLTSSVPQPSAPFF